MQVKQSTNEKIQIFDRNSPTYYLTSTKVLLKLNYFQEENLLLKIFNVYFKSTGQYRYYKIISTV